MGKVAETEETNINMNLTPREQEGANICRANGFFDLDSMKPAVETVLGNQKSGKHMSQCRCRYSYIYICYFS